LSQSRRKPTMSLDTDRITLLLSSYRKCVQSTIDFVLTINEPSEMEDELWGSFVRSSNSAARHASKIDGDLGQHLLLMRKSLFKIGDSLYANFEGSWKRDSGSDSVAFQRGRFVDACQDLRQSLTILVKMHRLKNIQSQHGFYARIDSVNTPFDPQYESNSQRSEEAQYNQEDYESEAPEQLPPGPSALFDAIPNEPIEIKEEPVDDVVVKEEPIEDVFCPSTGDFRQKDSTSPDLDDQSPGTSSQSQSFNAMDKRPRTIFIVRKSADGHKKELMTVDGKQTIPPSERPIEIPVMSDVMRKCYLCDSKTRIYYPTPDNPQERAHFLEGLIQFKDRDRNRIQLLRQNSAKAYFCVFHVVKPFSTRQQYGTNVGNFRMRRPGSYPLDIPATMITSNDRPPAVTPISTDPSKISVKAQAVKCSLCHELTEYYTATPMNPKLRDELLKKVTKYTKSDEELIENLRSSRERLYFCSSHINIEPNEEELELRRGQASVTRPRKCYLCGQMALPWLITPKFPTAGHLFFESLVELNDYQLELIDHLIKFNKRANICRKHYREPTFRNLDLIQAQQAKMKRFAENNMYHNAALNEDGLVTKQRRRDVVPHTFSSDYDEVKQEPLDEPGSSGF
ncbi:hypothetical protein PMAYCL1PPCAC_04708, partial [Pristionchus mayeri]